MNEISQREVEVCHLEHVQENLVIPAFLDDNLGEHRNINGGRVRGDKGLFIKNNITFFGTLLTKFRLPLSSRGRCESYWKLYHLLLTTTASK